MFYLPVLPKKFKFSEILAWWKLNSNQYPKLATLARKYLAIPETSAASEFVFRYGGLTVTNLRNRLNPETVCDLLFVRHFQES